MYKLSKAVKDNQKEHLRDIAYIRLLKEMQIFHANLSKILAAILFSCGVAILIICIWFVATGNVH